MTLVRNLMAELLARRYTGEALPETEPSMSEQPLPAVADGYNAMDYKNLDVSDNIRDLFRFIGR